MWVADADMVALAAQKVGPAQMLSVRDGRPLVGSQQPVEWPRLLWGSEEACERLAWVVI